MELEFPVEMYRVKSIEKREEVICERCLKQPHRIVNPSCPVCGGTGTKSQKIQTFVVAQKTELINMIDRDEEGTLRYWISCSEYSEEPERNLHFSRGEAQRECDRRNSGDYLREDFFIHKGLTKIRNALASRDLMKVLGLLDDLASELRAVIDRSPSVRCKMKNIF